MRSLFLLLLPFTVLACSVEKAEDAGRSEADLSQYDTMMKQACLEALGPAEPNASPALSDARARSLSGEAMLVDATMDVRYAFCSTREYYGERPSCSRLANRERANTSYSPSHLIEARESYRDVMGHIDVVDTKPSLVLEPRQVEYHGNRWISYEVTGSFEELTVTAKPRAGVTLPEDLAQAGSYSGITLHGRLGDGKLTVSTTPEPTVTWNTVSCARVSLYSSF